MTELTPDNAAEIIQRLAMSAEVPNVVDPGTIYAWLSPDGSLHMLDLTGDQYLDEPKRKRGTVAVRDVASLAQYYAKHATEHSDVFADLDAATITAVLNAHQSRAANWQDHRVTLTMVKTPQWETWTAANRKLMSQQVFAEFIEDNAADIAPGGPCTAADLVEMAQQFQAHTKVQFSSGKRLKSGQTQLVYSETIDAKAGERGTIEIPDAFELALTPFEDCDPYRVKARFRYRLNDGTVHMAFHLDDPARTFRDAVGQVVAKAEEACAVKIMRGRPA